MRFGLFLADQHPVGADMAARLHEHLEQTRLAGELDFDAVFCGEHFLVPEYHMFHQTTLLARLAAEAGTMHVGTGIMLLALHNPVEAADVAATLDVITGGRFIFGVGLGYREAEYAAFAVPRKGAARRFEKRLDLIQRLWTGEPVDYSGPDLTLQGATGAIKPLQSPRPPIWIAADNHPAVRRAARLGDAWFINPHAKLDVIEEQVGIYRQALADAGKPAPAVLPLLKEVYVAESQAEAERVARPYLQSKYATYVQWGQDKALPKGDALDLPFEELAQGRFVVGDPDRVIRELEVYVQRLGVNFFVFRLQWPGMSHELAARALRLVGRHVIPYFKGKYGAG